METQPNETGTGAGAGSNPLSAKTQAIVKTLTALAVDGLEHVPDGQTDQAIELIVDGLKKYQPGNKPDAKQFVSDAVAAIEALEALLPENEKTTKTKKATQWLGQIAELIAGGATPFAAILKALFKKQEADSAQ